MRRISLIFVLQSLLIAREHVADGGFIREINLVGRDNPHRVVPKHLSKGDIDTPESSNFFPSRRDALSSLGWLSSFLISPEAKNWAADDALIFRPAKRPTAYFVDSTIPPTLLPLSTARQQIQILADLGKGSGTKKESVVDDRINLNNMLNRAVFGTANRISDMLSPSNGGPTFVCMGLPSETSPDDIDLAIQLSSIILQARQKSGLSRQANTAIGLACCPRSVQVALDQYILSNGNIDDLAIALQKAGISERTVALYKPLFQWAQQGKWKLLALAPEVEDVITARQDGLQNVDLDRRKTYVPDASGFIALSQDPQYRVYTERSLLKDFEAQNPSDSLAKYFGERILVHEAEATAVAQFTLNQKQGDTVTTPSPQQQPPSLVLVLAPIRDVRFEGGINRRIPRLVQFLDAKNHAQVPPSAITTILINPTAAETLSKSRYLRLEIGTGPETIQYLAKVADYIWFSKMPKVNVIPRLMEG